MIKKIKIEILILIVLTFGVFLFHNLDVHINTSLKDFFQHIYLKKFFKQITLLGDSLWYFILSVVVFIVSYFFIKLSYLTDYKKIFQNYRNFSLFLLFSLIVSGAIVQSLKIIIGRPRPNHALLGDISEFNFFGFASEFHSFPSGHSSTIFVVALVLAFYFPKIKYFLLCLAGIVAISRIVVGAHFFYDIVAGAIVAFLSVKITNFIFEKNLLTNSNKNNSKCMWRHTLLSVVVFLLIAIFLAVGFYLDLYISELFYLGKKQFILQSYYGITVFFRKIILPFVILYTFVFPIFAIFIPIKKIYFNYDFSLKDIIFLWSSGIINLLIVVNLLLKNLWGRSRPGDILEFGGNGVFSPWFQISNSCASNCSFVSGDASVGFSIIALFFLTKNLVYFWSALLVGFGIGFIRILEGGHFLSDVVLAATILFIGYYIQYKFYSKKYV